MADNLRSIHEVNQKRIFEKLLNYDWIISKWHEKLILLAAYSWSFFSLGRFVWGWISG